MNMKFLLAGLAALTLAGCATNADIASQNISKAADNFEVVRRVVLYNGITDKYIQTVEGLCSIGNTDVYPEVTVTCKTPKGFVKHLWILSDNVTVFVEQLIDVDVSTAQYKVVFKPSAIIPSIDVK